MHCAQLLYPRYLKTFEFSAIIVVCHKLPRQPLVAVFNEMKSQLITSYIIKPMYDLERNLVNRLYWIRACDVYQFTLDPLTNFYVLIFCQQRIRYQHFIFSSLSLFSNAWLKFFDIVSWDIDSWFIFSWFLEKYPPFYSKYILAWKPYW